MKTKTCSKCSKEKSTNEFYKFKDSPDGLTYHCKACYKAYRDKNRERIRLYMQNMRETDNENVKAARRKSWYKTDPRKKLLRQAKGRSIRKNVEFNLKLEDIIIPDKCPLLDVPFIIGTRNDYEFTHSLDRIDPNKGYTKDNIWIMSKKANSMKNSATREELITFANNVFKYFKDDDIVQTDEKSLELGDKEPLG